MSNGRKGKYVFVILLLTLIAVILEFILGHIYLTRQVRHYTNHLIRDLMMIEISILFLWVSGENRNNTSADDDLQYRKRDYTKYFFISWLIIFSAFLAIDSIELYHLRSNSFLERIRDILILPLVATIVWIEILRKRKNWWQYLGYAGWIFLIIVFCFRNYFSPTVFVSLLILDAIITGAYFFMKKGQRSKNQN